MDRETDIEFAIATRHEAEPAVIELAGDDLDAVIHPFDAAERVLAAAS